MGSELLVIEQPKKPKKLLGFFLVILIISLVATSEYFFYQYQRLSKSPIISQVQAEEESQRLIKSVGKLMLLPKDESPTVATVTDIEKLKDQPFFKDAKNGNKVLIFPNLKQVIVYDPESNMIINVGSINISEKVSQEPLKSRIGLRNGTIVPGLTQKMDIDIKKLFPEITVASKDQSKRFDYEKTTVIALGDNSDNAAKEIAKSLGVEVGSLPDGEPKPKDLDILIIVGKDKT